MVAKDTSVVTQTLTSLLPTAWLEDSARTAGVLTRQRKLSLPLFFWTLIFGFAAGSHRSLSALRRLYEARAGTTIAHASFCERFNPALVRWMEQAHAFALQRLQARFPAPQATFLDGMREVLALDSSTFRLGAPLRAQYPSTSPQLAALKLHSVVNVLDGRTKTVKLSSGSASDVGRWSRLGTWVNGCLLTFDLGYFQYNLFSRVEQHQGYFLTRMKANANPLIVGENLIWRGNRVRLIGHRWGDMKARLAREVVDVQVEVEVHKQARKGKQTKEIKQWRLVGVRHPETDALHWYMTNLPAAQVSAEQVQKLYRLRWQVELHFKALKMYGRARKLSSHNEWVVKGLLWAALLLSVVSVGLRAQALCKKPAGQRLPWLRWWELMMTFACDILDEIAGFSRPFPVWDLLFRHAIDPNPRRPYASSFLPS